MKTIYYTATSLDGYIADENHSLDWLFQFGGEEESTYPEFIKDVGVVTMGSHTYEWLLANHVYKDPEKPNPWPYEIPCWIFTSRKLKEIPGANIHFTSEPVVAVHARMRDAAPGRNIWIAGGGRLAADFHAAGLLDEVTITLAPVFLGRGAPLFGGRAVEPPLERLEVLPFKNGMTEIRLGVKRN